MRTNSYIATLAAVLTTGLAGFAVAGPAALAAPPQGPGAPESAPAKPAGKGGKLTAPRSATSPAVVAMSGMDPGTKATLHVGPAGRQDGASTKTSATVGKDGKVTLSAPAPAGGWQPNQQYSVAVVIAEEGDPYWETTFTFSGDNQAPGARLTAPTSRTSPAVVSLSGMKPGKVTFHVAPSGRQDGASTKTSATVGKDGKVTLSAPAPAGGWKLNQQYVAFVTVAEGGDPYWETTFTYTEGSGTGTSSGGGLANTGR